MLATIRHYFKVQELKRKYAPLYSEIQDNLENYYVMFQLNRLRAFHIIQATACLTESDLNAPEFQEYARRLGEYNEALNDYKVYEAWYNQDLANKNAQNGRTLHEKKELAQAKFEGLEAVIKAAIPAIQALLNP